MNIKRSPKVFGAHCRTLEVPTGEAITPRRRPSHDVLRFCFFPKRKVLWIFFITLSVKGSGVVNEILYFSSTKFSVTMRFIELQNIKIDRTINFIGKTLIENVFYQFDLFNDVTCCCWLYSWGKVVELF